MVSGPSLPDLETIRKHKSLKDEFYVMNYLRMLASQVSIRKHPLETKFHLPITQAYQWLFTQDQLRAIANQLGCQFDDAFSRLRVLLDQWDGITLAPRRQNHALAPRRQYVPLIEEDAFKYLLDKKAAMIACRFLRCEPEAFISKLFDIELINKDCLRSVPPISKFPTSYEYINYFHTYATIRRLFQRDRGINDWWNVLERWVGPDMRAHLSRELNCQKSMVVHELFQRVKQELGEEMEGEKTKAVDPWQLTLKATTFGSSLPDKMADFWQMLNRVSSLGSSQIALDALAESELRARKPVDNANEALRIAEGFMTNQVVPMEKEVSRVDVFGMIAFRHRFQGILDELLGNALHYSNLAGEEMILLNVLHQLIQFFCYGEYHQYLRSLLTLKLLPLRNSSFPYKITDPSYKFGPGSQIVLYSHRDNARHSTLGNLFAATKEKPVLRPPREIQSGEVLIALRDDDHQRLSEVLCLSGLSDEDIDHLRNNLPTSVSDLSSVGDSVSELILSTPIPLFPMRARLQEALQENSAVIIRCLIFAGLQPDLLGLLHSPDIFGKIIPPLPSNTTLTLDVDLPNIKQNILKECREQGQRIDEESGF